MVNINVDYEGNKIKSIDRILLFICGDKTKMDHCQMLSSKTIILPNNAKNLVRKGITPTVKKRNKKRKEQRNIHKQLEILDKSTKYPYPIPANFIYKVLNIRDTTAHRLLNKLAKISLLNKNGKYWELNKASSTFNKLWERFHNKNLLFRFTDTQLYHDKIYPRFPGILNNILKNYPDLNINNKSLELQYIDMSLTPLFCFKLFKGIASKEVDDIFDYILDIIFQKEDNKKYRFKPIVYYSLLLYYQLRYNSEVLITNPDYRKTIWRIYQTIIFFINQIDKKGV